MIEKLTNLDWTWIKNLIYLFAGAGIMFLATKEFGHDKISRDFQTDLNIMSKQEKERWDRTMIGFNVLINKEK